jgi:hypothetical protein
MMSIEIELAVLEEAEGTLRAVLQTVGLAGQSTEDLKRANDSIEALEGLYHTDITPSVRQQAFGVAPPNAGWMKIRQTWTAPLAISR